MKWFKHISDSLDDPFICELMDEFGHEGYVAFFGTLEIYSREFSPEEGWKLSVTLSYFHRKLRISPKKYKKILSKIYKWEVNHNDTHVSIYIPKFRELLDEWTMRKLGSKSGETPKKLSADKDKDKDKEPPIVPQAKKLNGAAFAAFWRVYPKKKSRGQAEKAFKKINPDEQLLASMIAKIEQARKSEQWLKDSGQFIPYPATWLNAKGWEDELEAKPQGSW